MRGLGALRIVAVRVAAGLAVLLVATGCVPGSGPAPAPPSLGEPAGPGDSAPSVASRLLDPAAFAAAVAEPGRVTINVHVPFEGSIPGTDANVPFHRIAADSPGLPAARRSPLAIYCKSGRMSAAAASELARLGFGDVVELRGGMDAWTQRGLPLLAGPAPATAGPSR